MGKKPKWLGAVKKVFSPESKDEKLRRKFAAATGSVPYPPDLTPSASLEAHASALPPAHTDDFEEFEATPPGAPVSAAPVAEDDQQRRHEPERRERAAPATEQALPVAAPEVAAAVVVASSSLSEERAATKIQTAFRGYLARRALRALKGLVRLKSLVEGHSVKRQATSTLRCMQTLSRVQSKIRTRRIKMSEENQALQRQLLLNQELESLRGLCTVHVLLRRPGKQTPKAEFMSSRSPSTITKMTWDLGGLEQRDVLPAGWGGTKSAGCATGDIGQRARCCGSASSSAMVSSSGRWRQSVASGRRRQHGPEGGVASRMVWRRRHGRIIRRQMGDQWNTSLQSKEQIEAGLVSKQEAAARRERALAYAFSHQWKSTSRSTNPMFVDPNNPHWGWSWLERWMAARPACEGRNGTTEKESNTDRMSVNSTSLNPSEGEITKVDSYMDSNLDKPSPATPKPSRPAASKQSPSTPSSSRASPALARKKSATPKNGACMPGGDDDVKSVFSVQSERPRRHSIGTSSVRDDASLSGSSPSSVPSYMAPTKSAKAKTRLQSPVAEESAVETLEKGWSVGSAKKRLSFPAGMAPPSPSPMRRHSGPPKIPQASATAESNEE